MNYMKYENRYNKLAGLTLSLLALAIPFHNAVAEEPVVLSDESLYLYNALENKNSVTLLFEAYSPTVAIADTVVVPENENLEEKIAKQVDEVAEKQNYVSEQIDNLIGKIEDGSGIGKFLLGTKLGMLRFQLVQVKDQIYRLKQLDTKSSDITNKTKIETGLGLASEMQAKIENFIMKQERKFSLLGWFTKVL